MKLQQGQIWKTHPDIHGHNSDSIFLRIVHLERLAVDYKEVQNLLSPDGKHKSTTKKEFCRLIKNGTLIEGKQPPLTD